MLPASAGATAAKVLVCFLYYAVKFPLGGGEKMASLINLALMLEGFLEIAFVY
jgi:hypothetical protein